MRKERIKEGKREKGSAEDMGRLLRAIIEGIVKNAVGH